MGKVLQLAGTKKNHHSGQRSGWGVSFRMPVIEKDGEVQCHIRIWKLKKSTLCKPGTGGFKKIAVLKTLGRQEDEIEGREG